MYNNSYLQLYTVKLSSYKQELRIHLLRNYLGRYYII